MRLRFSFFACYTFFIYAFDWVLAWKFYEVQKMLNNDFEEIGLQKLQRDKLVHTMPDTFGDN